MVFKELEIQGFKSFPDKVARGEGRSKKMAEQHAAREALKLLGVIKEK